jgi:hypothetical protein
MAQEGSIELNGYNCSSGETSVDMYKLMVVMEKSSSDIEGSEEATKGAVNGS